MGSEGEVNKPLTEVTTDLSAEQLRSLIFWLWAKKAMTTEETIKAWRKEIGLDK
jgi:hypothetical protein